MSLSPVNALHADDRVMLIKIGKSAKTAKSAQDLYEHARKWWKASLAQAQLGRRVLAVVDNEVVAAYEPRRWEVSDDPETEGRVAFHGVEAKDSNAFVGLAVKHLYPQGASNPIRYTTVGALGTAIDSAPATWNSPAAAVTGELHLLLRINKSWHEGIEPDALYEATRGYWAMSATKAEQVTRAFAVAGGVVREVYEPLAWVPSPKPGEEHRVGFEGAVAQDRDRWVGLDVSAVFPHGSQNPVRYVDVRTWQQLVEHTGEVDEPRPRVELPSTGPDLAEQLTPLLQALQDDLLWSMSRAAQELFHSNTLAWLMAEHPVTTRPLRAAFEGSHPAERLNVWREWRNIDIVASSEDDRSRFVIENKLYSIPYVEQLEKYASKPLPWSDSHSPSGADATSYYLLTLMDPNFALPEPWHRISYEQVLRALEAMESEAFGQDATLFDRYRTLVRRLVDLKEMVDPRNDVEGPFSVKEVMGNLQMKWFAGPLQRMRFTGLAQMVAEEYGAQLPLGVDLTRGMGLITYARRLSDTRVAGWQLQEGQLRLFVLIQDQGLAGKGKRLAEARAQVAEAEYKTFADFTVAESVLGDHLKPMALGEGEWRRFAPDFVYRYRKVHEATSSQQLSEALAELTAHVDAFR